MKTTWSVDNIKVKDNFYDFYVNDVCRQLFPVIITTKGSLSLLVKALHHSGQILAIGTIREQIFGRFLSSGENIFIKDCSGEMNCGTKLYSIVRGKKGKGDMICFFIVFIAVFPVRIQL
jgi:hypothetical protein